MSTGAVTLTPGYAFNEVAGERLDLSKLNRLGRPIARVNEGAIGRRELQPAILETLDGASAGISELWTIVVAADEALASRIVTLESSITDLDAGLSGVATGLDSLTTRVTTTEGGITSLATRTTALEAGLTTANGAISANANATNTLTTRVTTTENGLTALGEDLEAISQDVSTLEVEVDGLTARIGGAETAISANAGATSALTARVTATEGAVTALTSDVTELESRLVETETGLVGQAAATNSLTTRVTTAEGGITALATRTTALETGLTTANGAISANAGATSALTTRITTAENGLTAVTTANSELQATVNHATTGLAPTRAKVTTLTDALVAPDGTVRSRYSALLTADGNGQLVQTGWEMIAENAPNRVISAIRMLANLIEVRSTVNGAPVTPFVIEGNDVWFNASVMIKSATITDAMIASLSVDKLTAGIVTALVRMDAADLRSARFASGAVAYNAANPPGTAPLNGVQSVQTGGLGTLYTTVDWWSGIRLYGWGTGVTYNAARYTRPDMVFNVVGEPWFNLNQNQPDGSAELIYRINSGAWTTFGWANDYNPYLPGAPMIVPLALTVGAYDWLDFGMRLQGWNHAGNRMAVTWNNL